MSDIMFKQQVQEVLSSTKSVEYSTYRRLVYGETFSGSTRKSLLDYMVCPSRWDRMNEQQKLVKLVESIASGMSQYLFSSPAPNTYKQKIYSIFMEWLKKICTKYNVPNNYKEFLKEPIKMDTGIAFLKAFHQEELISKSEIKDKAGLSDEKLVQTWLRKIDPSLSESGSGKEGEYRIAGHRVTADIIHKETDKYGKKYYYMPSTVHPLVLQQNVMQVGILLKSLCSSYNSYSFTSYDIALDIWAQLSEYAKNRIRDYFGRHDKLLEEFLEELTDELNHSERVRIFKTEQEIMLEGGLSAWEKICLAIKNNVECNIRLLDSTGKVHIYKRQRIISAEIKGQYEYLAVSTEENVDDYEKGVILKEENVLEIEYV